MRLFLDCLHLGTKIYQKNHFPHFLSRSGLGIQEKGSFHGCLGPLGHERLGRSGPKNPGLSEFAGAVSTALRISRIMR